MKRCMWFFFLLMLSCAQQRGDAVSDLETEKAPAVYRYETTPGSSADATRFLPLDIFIHSKMPVGAYQVALMVESGRSEIVGVEGGSLPGFTDAPLYDPGALQQRRIILAAYNTKKTIPAGRRRVATVHMMETGNAKVTYRLKVIAAADADGQPVQIQVELAGREN